VTDSGWVNIDARLAPGLDFDGFQRPVPLARLSVSDRALQPDSTRPDGTLRYLSAWKAGPSVVLDPITLVAPEVDGLVAAPPALEWFGPRRAGPDSIEITRGEDLLLPVVMVNGPSRPEASLRQWFLTLSSGDRSFRLSSDGVPPNPISIPPHWIPEGDAVEVRLIFSQSATLRDPPGDYLGVVTADTWLFWSVFVEG
jgi:hypothetical protein